MAFLLLSSRGEAQESDQALFENAQQQQNLLTEQYGVLDNSGWQQRCDQLIEVLLLTRFQQCIIIKAEFPNAYSLAHGVVILTQGLLKNIRNNDQLAHILAHEHAHLMLNHHQQAAQLVNNPPKFFTKSRIKKFYRGIESQADQAADDLLRSHQLDSLQIHHYLQRIEKNIAEHSSDHEKLKDRIQRTSLLDEVIEAFWSND